MTSTVYVYLKGTGFFMPPTAACSILRTPWPVHITVVTLWSECFLQLQESEKNSTTAVFLSSAEFYGLLAFCLGITKASLPILLSVIK